MVVVRAVGRNIYGGSIDSGHVVPAGTALPASADIMVRGTPPRQKDGQIPVKISVTDDEGRAEKLSLNLPVMGMQQLVIPVPTPEMVAAIPDAVEKHVTSVLQAELARYQQNGRRVGRLGSVYITVDGYTNSTLSGENGPQGTTGPRTIFDRPQDAKIQSDKLASLLTLYKRLGANQERERFVNVLMTRIGPDGAYLSVTYFIVLALFQVGKLPEALTKARAVLPAGDSRSYSLSNVLMLLNGMLRFCHADFSNDMLDAIERFYYGLNEHPFGIPQKIADIRTIRLAAPNQDAVGH